MDTVKICGIAILASICFFVVKNINSSFELPMRVAVVVAFFGFAIGLAVPIFRYFYELISSSALSEWQGALFGAVGIALLTHLAAEICRAFGVGNLPEYVELVGKIEILVLCLPLVKALLEEVEGLVG